MTLEDKINRIKEIQSDLEKGLIPLSESFKFLEEALKLKTEVEKELNDMQTKLINLSDDSSQNSLKEA